MEFLDIVDQNDNVIGTASRNEVYEKSLCHRIAHVLIFNEEGKIVLQKRSDKVCFCPGHWSTAVGGHVQTGETYEQAALREYQEELGAKSILEFVGKDLYNVPHTPNKFLTTFRTQFNGPFDPDAEEVSEVGMFDIQEIQTMLERGEKFHPELIFILKKYYL
ncbi:MAG: NUDIX domain-containing protein [Patescibacteria group bacterium]|nr:NUDIX domain-containing protein [Patescibacteria group bacterium]